MPKKRHAKLYRRRPQTYFRPLTWPGPQDGLGRGGKGLNGPRVDLGQNMTKTIQNLGIEFSIVENLSGLQESIFNLSRGPQVQFDEQIL